MKEKDVIIDFPTRFTRVIISDFTRKGVHARNFVTTITPMSRPLGNISYYAPAMHFNIYANFTFKAPTNVIKFVSMFTPNSHLRRILRHLLRLSS